MSRRNNDAATVTPRGDLAGSGSYNASRLFRAAGMARVSAHALRTLAWRADLPVGQQLQQRRASGAPSSGEVPGGV